MRNLLPFLFVVLSASALASAEANFLNGASDPDETTKAFEPVAQDDAYFAGTTVEKDVGRLPASVIEDAPMAEDFSMQFGASDPDKR